MTKPEETTAALIARLHNELEAARKGIERLIGERDYHKKVQAEAQDGHDHALNMLRAAMRERDEQRARAERAKAERDSYANSWRMAKDGMEQAIDQRNKTEDELAKERQRASDQRARAETLAQRVEERTGERDEARIEVQLWKAQAESAEKDIERRQAELKQLASLCPRKLTHQLNVEVVKSRLEKFAEQEAGRNKEAARMRKERDEASEQLAKLEWSAFRRPDCGGPLSVCCPSCQGVKPGHEVGSAFKRDEVGHRPTCWFAKKEASTKIRNHRKDCPARTAEDMAWGDSHWTGTLGAKPIGPRSNPIGCEGCRCAKADEGEAKPPTPREQWKTKQAHYDHWLDARPEPRFKVGQKVIETAIAWEVGEVMLGAYEWWYRAPGATWVEESKLKPAPKFAVGEWVTLPGGAGSVKRRDWNSDVYHSPQWLYVVDRDDRGRDLKWESELTAQIPQHKHDCTGSVFLGQHERFDLWWRPTMREVVAVEPSVAHCYSVDGELLSKNPLAIEALRRAVARGLVK